MRAWVSALALLAVLPGRSPLAAAPLTFDRGPSPDPRLTGFAFNVPDAVTGLDSFSGPARWSADFGPNDIDTPGQIGFFDLAGIQRPNFGDRELDSGIPVGFASHFESVLLSSGLNPLDETSFPSLLSVDPAGNPNEDPDEPQVIPEPAPLLLLGGGLTALWFFGRRQRP